MTLTLTAPPSDLAAAWLEVDPDPETREVITRLLAGPSEELVAQFGKRLTFGTAGLRGPVGAGPNHMSRVLVRVVATALAQRVLDAGGDDPHLVVGYDARNKSRDFAEDTVRAAVAKGLRATLLPGPLPTPVLAFAVRHLNASAGVMVTASHNPAPDNGYKVYWRGGAQIASPLDSEISDLIDVTPLISEDDLAPFDHPAITVADTQLVDTYLNAILELVSPEAPRTAQVAYTPLHGVGCETLLSAFARAGFPAPAVVATQAQPDPTFPTAPFPNPEETGVLEPLLQLATATNAQVALANDPDADRLAVAIPENNRWRLLTGDELGCLLAEYLLARSREAEPLVINTVVSSRLLREIADHHEATYIETLTGFKWLMHARQLHPDKAFVLGYEEALGYCIGDVVADKDGVSAALVVAEIVGVLAAQGRTLADLLNEIHVRHGVHATGQRSLRFEATNDTPMMTLAMDHLRDSPPAELAGKSVTKVVDLADPGGDLAPTNGIILEIPGGRVVVRPSGTEPKMKVYGETIVAATDDLSSARREAHRFLLEMLTSALSYVAAPDARPTSTEGDTDTEARAAAAFAEITTGPERADDLRLVVRCIDLTTLEGDDTPGRIRALCATAKRPDPADPTVGPVAAVCVYPSFVALARELLGSDGPVEVASVAGSFPAGQSPPEVRLVDIQAAVDAGAGEIDMVLDRGAFLSGREQEALDAIKAAKRACGEAHLKVIIEVGELGSLHAVAEATRLAIAGGADWVKTSTGKTANNATPATVLTMAEVIAKHHSDTGEVVGLKVAGGVSSADEALGYLAIVRAALGEAWLTPERFRFGASGLLTKVI